MRYLPLFVVALAVGSTVTACGSDRDRSGFAGAPADPAPGGDLGGGDPSLGGGDDPSTGQPEACAAEVTSANRAEVDVIVVIDTSGSMMEETNQVKQNLNSFAQSIGNTGLDYNVIMIASKPKKIPFAPPGFTPPGICVTPPLAGADCADGPKFHHLDTSVGSFDSLQIILDKYAQYEKWLRPTAYKVFIEVTDDNSSLPYDSFDPQLLAKSSAQFGDAAGRRYIFNSICGYKRGTPILSVQKCSSAENTGDQYQHLSQLTGGTVDSVCEASYASVFDNIAKGLITRLGCEFSIPKAEGGKETDPTTVVVTYTPGDGSAKKALTQVTDASKCGANPDGWYYDDAASPTKILFCPSTCSSAGADTAGKLDVAIGCKAPPPK
ncbi:MAG: VWA domain-containing protein [Labilithrix sp.]|nr:VWA domain-containing protein [Labilithrix sp.]